MFSRPESAIPKRAISFEPNFVGESYVRLAMEPPPGTQAEGLHIAATYGGETIDLDLRANSQGFLARADARAFVAAGFQDAEDKAYRALATTLSHWTAELDVPIEVCRVYSRELATESRRVSYQVPFADVTFSPASVGRVDDEARFYLSLYREGLASNSPAYQFLCFYKIIEGVRLRRNRLDQAQLQAGARPSRQPERIPESDGELSTWLNGLFLAKRRWDDLSLGWTVPKEARGKKVGHLFLAFTSIRDNIAHALTDSGEFGHTADGQLNSPELVRWLPLVRCIARWMIKNEFADQFLVGA